MGQYYQPINLTTFEWLYSHDYGNGLKLMEHSYIGNNFVGRIMKLLIKGGKWYKGRIIWAGDYFDEVKVKGETLYSMCFEDDEAKIKLFKKIKPRLKMKEVDELKAMIVNHSKREYVKLSECEKNGDDFWIIHPLPLLTALGNGRGGGDYNGRDMNLIGRWAFDEISVEFDEKEFEGFTKIKPNFSEERKENGTFAENNIEGNERIAGEEIKKWIKSQETQRRIMLEVLR